MASPFRHNKKERRRLRKDAAKLDALAGIRPKYASVLEKMAVDTLKIAGAKRRNPAPRHVILEDQFQENSK